MKCTRSINIKKSNSKIARIGEKRSINDSNINTPRKRVRKPRSQIRKSQSTTNSTKKTNFISIELSNDTNQNTRPILDVELLRRAGVWSNSVPLRLGRTIRQPKRFL